jgi:hypothetical protein
MQYGLRLCTHCSCWSCVCIELHQFKNSRSRDVVNRTTMYILHAPPPFLISRLFCALQTRMNISFGILIKRPISQQQMRYVYSWQATNINLRYLNRISHFFLNFHCVHQISFHSFVQAVRKGSVGPSSSRL